MKKTPERELSNYRRVVGKEVRKANRGVNEELIEAICQQTEGLLFVALCEINDFRNDVSLAGLDDEPLRESLKDPERFEVIGGIKKLDVLRELASRERYPDGLTQDVFEAKIVEAASERKSRLDAKPEGGSGKIEKTCEEYLLKRAVYLTRKADLSVAAAAREQKSKRSSGLRMKLLKLRRKLENDGRSEVFRLIEHLEPHEQLERLENFGVIERPKRKRKPQMFHSDHDFSDVYLRIPAVSDGGTKAYQLLFEALSKLPKDQYDLLRRYFKISVGNGGDKKETMRSLAEDLGLSKDTVSRRIRGALVTLKSIPGVWIALEEMDSHCHMEHACIRMVQSQRSLRAIHMSECERIKKDRA